MAEEEAKGLDYIPEIVLKKRKNRDELAFIRKKQLELGNSGKKKKKVSDIKRPEDFVHEFRAKVHFFFSRFSEKLLLCLFPFVLLPQVLIFA